MAKSHRTAARRPPPAREPEPPRGEVRPVNPTQAPLGPSGALGLQDSVGNAGVASLIEGEGGHAADDPEDHRAPRQCVEQPESICRCPSSLRELDFPCSRSADLGAV